MCDEYVWNSSLIRAEQNSTDSNRFGRVIVERIDLLTRFSMHHRMCLLNVSLCSSHSADQTDIFMRQNECLCWQRREPAMTRLTNAASSPQMAVVTAVTSPIAVTPTTVYARAACVVCSLWLNFYEHLYSSQRTDTDRKTDMYKRNKNYKTTHIIQKHTI